MNRLARNQRRQRNNEQEASRPNPVAPGGRWVIAGGHVCGAQRKAFHEPAGRSIIAGTRVGLGIPQSQGLVGGLSRSLHRK